jgi:hypothetical protein
MNRATRWIPALTILLAATSLVSADDLTGSDEFLCTPMMANACDPDEGCAQKAPWTLNVPLFIEVDLKGKKMSTTEASGLNRATEIKNLLREDGLIVLQGYQERRAFSMVISEETGMLTFSVSSEDQGAVIFGACTPKP